MEKESLLIPQGLRIKNEIFDGYGKSELLVTIAVTAISGVIALVIYGFTQSVIGCIIFILVMSGGSIMMLTRDKHNMSVVLQVKLLLRFYRSQKKYRYSSHSWKG